MKVAILDVSADELASATKQLDAGDSLLPQPCNVAVPEDCVAAAAAVAEFAGDAKIGFLFNNAGIQGPASAGGIIGNPDPESISAWQQIFNVRPPARPAAGYGGPCRGPGQPPAERVLTGALLQVNVFGAVNILKAFVPGMIAAGPLASGKAAFVVTTSSVVGLLRAQGGSYASFAGDGGGGAAPRAKASGQPST